MAGAGVSVGGAGMLRARRRDVSVKPNRKLDRKSSRGMIYENEELRLRTIHINAEVEQGQNDIKKLRRENEQLRREIWSLRDEYDKLEEILKSQKNREDSEDYEDRSGDEDKDDDDEAEECSEYSSEENEEAEEDCNEEEKNVSPNDDTEDHEGGNQEERLENAENQKISSEKMNSSNHRLHVEFDDLSVVDEEEELKKDKERKEVSPLEEPEIPKTMKEPDLVHIQPRNGYQCFPPNYGSPGTSGSANSYYPYAFPNSDVTEFTEMLPIEPAPMLLTACPGLYDNSFPPVTSFESSFLSNVPPGYDDNLRSDPIFGGSPIGWQSSIFAPNTTFQTPESYQPDLMANQTSGMCPVSMADHSGQSDYSSRTASTARATSISRVTPVNNRVESSSKNSSPLMSNFILPSFLQQKKMLQKQPNSFYRETIIPNRVGVTGYEVPSSAEVVTQNGWDFGAPASSQGNVRMCRDTDERKNTTEGQRERSEAEDIVIEREGLQRHEDSTLSACGSDRPKHFFAPLPAKIHHGRQDSGDKMITRTTNPNDSPSTGFFETFGTGMSSSSERTNSTVISGRHFQPHSQTLTEIFSDSGEKGSADIFVNGGVAKNEQQDCRINEERSYKSSENLLIVDRDNSRGNSSSRQSSNNPLLKSVSCQDLSSEPLQNSIFEITRTFQADSKSQKFAKSDNTLDNPIGGSSKPFRSQLNVTLKFPCESSSFGKDHGRCSPKTPEIPKLPTIDYRLFNNPFLKTFEPRDGNDGNYDIRGPVTRPLSIQVNENLSDRGKSYLQQLPSIDYSSPVLTQAFARRLNPDENTIKSTRRYGTSEVESDRHRVAVSSVTSQAPSADSRIIVNPKQRQEFQVTSFEQPNPRSLHQGLSAYDLDSLRRLPATVSTTVNPPIPNNRKLYQNVPFVPGAAGIFCSPGQNPVRMFYESQTQKVPAQTQTSIDGGSNNEDEIVGIVKNVKTPDTENLNASGSPTSVRRKRIVRKERGNVKTEKRPLSPAAQRRRLRKQSNIDAVDVAIEQTKSGNKTRKCSPAMTNTTTTTNSEHLEEKNESRSSSSGQDSPRKEHNRRVSMYFNSKKRPSLVSVKTTRSASIDNTKENFGIRGAVESMDTTNSERERTNSASSREAASGKTRKSSVSSGKLPWCACWGNGCV